MNKTLLQRLWLSTTLILFIACRPTVGTKTAALDSQIQSSIDSLALRYLDLGRFSGSILLAKEGQVIYHKFFGLADYENQKLFTANSGFQVWGVEYLVNDILLEREIKGQSYPKKLKKLGQELKLDYTFSESSAPEKAVGYLYHNYRGRGLELQRAKAPSADAEIDAKSFYTTPKDLLKILEAYAKETHISGYLEDDGFSYALIHNQEIDQSLIILSNRRHPVCQEIAESIKAILAIKDYQLPLARKAIAMDSSSLKEFYGDYALNANVKFTIGGAADSLWVQLGPQKTKLIAQSANQFYLADRDASMRFLKDEGGQYNRVMLLDGFLESEQIAYREE